MTAGKSARPDLRVGTVSSNGVRMTPPLPPSGSPPGRGEACHRCQIVLAPGTKPRHRSSGRPAPPIPRYPLLRRVYVFVSPGLREVDRLALHVLVVRLEDLEDEV